MINANDRKINRLFSWVLFLILLSVFIASPALGQTGADKVRAELEKTDNLIERAIQLVEESGSPQAQQYLEKAVHLQNMAKDNFQAKRYQQAYRLTQQSRTMVEKAVGLIRNTGENRVYVQRELEHTEDLLHKAKDILGPETSEFARMMLERAFTAQENAKDLFHRNRQKMALASTLRAREFVRESMESARDFTQTLRELDKTDQLLEKARERVAESDLQEIPPAFVNAVEAQEKTKILYHRKNHEQALHFTLEAREIIYKALEQYEEVLRSEKLPLVFEELEEELRELGATLSTNPDELAEMYYERARKAFENAQKAYDDGQTRQAVYHLRRTSKNLDEAKELLGF